MDIASGVAEHVQPRPPQLPQDAEAVYVGEGAANVVFAIKLPPTTDTSLANAFQDKLLRVPKAGKGTFPYAEQQAFWESQIKPLFRPGDLVHQSLVRMPEDNGFFVARLNEILHERESQRRDDFVGSQVEDVTYGMLVDDMRSTGDGDIIREFKPKWLAQSPNAPETAIRCRNCAREALRNVEKGKRKPIFCPLNFLASTTEQSVRVLRYFDLPTSFAPGLSQTKDCYQWLGAENVLQILRANQVRLDRGGPLNVSAHDAAFQVAMTLRDCTVYLKIPKEPGQGVTAKLGDLDKKNWDIKLDYWRAMEQNLIDGGFYEAKETPLQETDCMLIPPSIGGIYGTN